MTASIIIIAIFLFVIWFLNKRSRNDFFYQSEIIIRNKLKFISDIWIDFEYSKYDEVRLRIAFEYFIVNPSEYNGTSIIADNWLIKGLEPESVIHDYDYIIATSLKDLLLANKEYCQRLRKRNTQWLWVWVFIYSGLTIVSIFKSFKYIKLWKK